MVMDLCLELKLPPTFDLVVMLRAYLLISKRRLSQERRNSHRLVRTHVVAIDTSRPREEVCLSSSNDESGAPKECLFFRERIVSQSRIWNLVRLTAGSP